MKIIFLDIDGVLNDCYTEETFCGFVFVSDEKVALLKEIADSTNAQIVLTSTWRQGWYIKDHFPHQSSEDVWLFEALQEKLAEFGLELMDYTENCGHRGQEISLWLQKHKDAVSSYIVIDDTEENHLQPHTSRLVQTDIDIGLTEYQVEQAIQLLSHI